MGVVWSRSSSSEVGPVARADGAGSPVRVWIEPASSDGVTDPEGEEKVVDSSTVRGLSALYAPSAIPLLLSAHVVLALVKLNTKLAYLPIAMSDPAGTRSYMAIWEFGTVPGPGMLFSLNALKTASLVLLAAGAALSLLAHFRISGREGRGALPMLFTPLFLAVVVFGAFILLFRKVFRVFDEQNVHVPGQERGRWEFFRYKWAYLLMIPAVGMLGPRYRKGIGPPRPEPFCRGLRPRV